MLDFLDVYERALKGPLMSEKDFDMKVFIPTLNKVVKDYEIKYDKENPLPSDDGAADNIFDAAVDFFSQVGMYVKDTNRVIQVSKEELLEAVKRGKGKCLVGEGKDAGVMGMRRPDDGRRPWLHVGRGGVVTSEEMMTNLVESWASIPGVQSLGTPSSNSIRGIPIVAGSPGEIYAAIRNLRIAREACRRAGRPGLPFMNLVSSAATAVTAIAGSAPQFGMRPSDGWLCAATSEMKIDFGILNKVAYLLNWGANIGGTASAILGGYCGGPPGTAVVITAYFLAGMLILKGDFQVSFPIHFTHGVSSSRDVMCAVSMSCQAASRNIPTPVMWLGEMGGGPNTNMYFYEAAAYLLCEVTSGSPAVYVPHPAKSGKIDGSTPMEAEFGVEMAIAASKLTRDKARGIVLRLLEKYESQIPSPPEGDRYQDCYDVTTGKPKEEYIRLYNEMKEELAAMGIPFE